jgi:hypothetical protein
LIAGSAALAAADALDCRMNVSQGCSSNSVSAGRKYTRSFLICPMVF